MKINDNLMEKVCKILGSVFSSSIVKMIMCMIMLALGCDAKSICAAVKLSLKSVRKYEAILESEEGADLKSIKRNGRVSDLEKYKDVIFAELDAGAYKTLREIQIMIQKKTGIVRSRQRIGVFLRKHGYSPLKVGFLPAKADPAAQRKFYEETLIPLFRQAQTGEVSLFFLDASHFVMGGYSGSIWSRNRRFVQTASGRQRYNVLGAINFVTKKVETVTNDTYITATQVNEMLELLSKSYQNVNIILDNVSYQKCKAVKDRAAELGIKLIFLPTYSPNLNLIERLWKFVKAQVLNAAYLPTFAEFRKSIDDCLSETDGRHKSAIGSLITEKVQLYDEVQLQTVIVA